MTKTTRRAATALLAASAALGSAQAAVLGVARIEVTLTDVGASGVLQVAEVVAMANGVDVASAGTATATGSSTWPTALASRAIDGNTGGDFYLDGIYHSALGDAAPTLTIDFGGATFDIDALTLFGHTDCCQGRDVYDLAFYALDGTELFAQSGLATRGGSVAADLPANPVPLPAGAALLVPGFVGLIASRRRRA